MPCCRLPRSSGLASAQGVDDCPVLSGGVDRQWAQLQREHARAMQLIFDGAGHSLQPRIATGSDKRFVKLFVGRCPFCQIVVNPVSIGFDPALRIRHGAA